MRSRRGVKQLLFVCVANICRSPALMATLNHLAALQKVPLHADSCGIGWVHLGERPSQRMFEAAKKRGVLIDHRTEQFQDSFFESYDLILAVSPDIVEQLKLRAGKYQSKIVLVTDYSSKYKGMAIPDPYYLSDGKGFDEVFDLIFDCCQGLIESFRLPKQGDL